MAAGGAHHPTAVVLSAHVSGYDVVRGRLADVVTLVHPSGTRVECGRLTGTAWRVALCETGTGALTAAALTTQLFDWLRPQALLLVGVARPLKGSLPPGSVVVATKVYGVQGGRAAPEGFLARPEVWRCSHRLEQTARHALRGGAHFAPVAVSDVVLADPESAPARSLRQHYEDAVAIETDSTGVLHAAHLGGRPDTLVVHGIGGADECRDGPGGREDPDLTAAQAAAEAVVEVLRRMEPATRAARSGHLRGRLLLVAGLLGLSVTAFGLWQQWSGRSDAVASPGAAGASPSPAARPSPSPTGTAPSRRPTPSPSPDDGHGRQRPTPSLPPENLLPPPGVSASVTVGPTTVEVTPAPSAPAPPTPTASQFEALISWTDDGSCEGDCPVKAYRTPQEDDTQFTGTLYLANQKFLVACQKDNGRRMKVGARYSGPGFQNGVWFYVAERREWVSGARVSVTPFPLPAVCP
ncbi:5'-methylthioadenosine/S-adenosylhomocysteine nucleosidase family protein [Streptomyces hilarionis]|uniref:5'-methylthioadenosine/S-adenosylhomocysteine nucleosidase family protein n=1 Tax=Streptomyces hilarionis TaxID=2839954 RepID=UPI00211A6840|nr:hypothetical protein [Streptomyces hilarionis]MCQ9135741.1 hypothetical protein [Streptomyces hilarionis]